MIPLRELKISARCCRLSEISVKRCKIELMPQILYNRESCLVHSVVMWTAKNTHSSIKMFLLSLYSCDDSKNFRILGIINWIKKTDKSNVDFFSHTDFSLGIPELCVPECVCVCVWACFLDEPSAFQVIRLSNSWVPLALITAFSCTEKGTEREKREPRGESAHTGL